MHHQQLRRRPPSPAAPLSGAPSATLVRAAAAGDRAAWDCLVRRMTPMIRRIGRGFQLSPADIDDIVQAAWLQALRHIGHIHEPAAFGGWLAVTARRECLRQLQRGSRELSMAEPPEIGEQTPEDPAGAVVDAQRAGALHEAVERLPGRQRTLLAAILSRPESSYAELSSSLAMPIGSIGPTRERALERLREDPVFTRDVA